MNKAPTITAIVVSRNEAHQLDACLSRLRWCEQLIVVDLASTDATKQVAARHADLVLDHPFSPIVEPVRCFAAEHATGDWLLFIDPDEQVPAILTAEIRRAVTQEDAGVIALPWMFYFKGKALGGTVWGGPNRTKRFLSHRDRAHLLPLSQSGIHPRPGFREITIHAREGNHVRHDWVNSYRQLIEKHVRLAWNEGKPRYENGLRFRWQDVVSEPWQALKYCLIARDGWREGPRGFVLSAVYAGYTFIAAISLACYPLIRRATSDETALASTAESVSKRKAA